MHDLLKRLVPAQKIAMKHNFGSVNFYFFSKVFIQNCKFSVFIQSINTQEQYIFQNLLHSHTWNFSRKVLRILKIIHTCKLFIYIQFVLILPLYRILSYTSILPRNKYLTISYTYMQLYTNITSIILDPAKGHYALQHFLCKAHNKWQWVHVWKYWRSSLNILVIIT